MKIELEFNCNRLDYTDKEIIEFKDEADRADLLNKIVYYAGFYNTIEVCEFAKKLQEQNDKIYSMVEDMCARAIDYILQNNINLSSYVFKTDYEIVTNKVIEKIDLLLRFGKDIEIVYPFDLAKAASGRDDMPLVLHAKITNNEVEE